MKVKHCAFTYTRAASIWNTIDMINVYDTIKQHCNTTELSHQTRSKWRLDKYYCALWYSVNLVVLSSDCFLSLSVIYCIRMFKGSIFFKNRHFIIQKRFNELIYGINTIIKCATWQHVKFQLVSHSWNEKIFYRISELMLPTLIQRYDKKSFHFWSISITRD